MRARAFLCPLDCLCTPLTIPEDLANGLPLPDCCSPFCFLFWDFVESRRSPGACSSLRCSCGFEEVLDESCGGDVEDDLVPELDDNP